MVFRQVKQTPGNNKLPGVPLKETGMKIALTPLLILILLFPHNGMSQEAYPYPVKYIQIQAQQQHFRTAYMDISPEKSKHNKVALLLHGKNFNGYYWKDVVPYLLDKGYRVIVPDQVGWGKSDKPEIHYSFHELATYTRMLLDSLHIGKVTIIGHSMGGMLATRFTLMYPDITDKLILEDPIGLEDYREFVPYASVDQQYASELDATFDSYKSYMKGYFPEWKQSYDELVRQQAAALKDPDFPRIALVNTLTYEMIYEQPVCYEFKDIKKKTLLIVGSKDKTIPGKVLITRKVQKKHGQYQKLGKDVQLQMSRCQLVELDGIGHIPHIQDLNKFEKAIDIFLEQ